MVQYIEIISKFRDDDVEHEISVHKSINECNHSHAVLYECNSDNYSMLKFHDDDDDDIISNLFRTEREPCEALWLVFRFYESSVDAAFVFDQEALAKATFESEACEITPYEKEIKVTEAHDDGYEMCCTYVKFGRKYILPDKATRVVKVCLPRVGETITI